MKKLVCLSGVVLTLLMWCIGCQKNENNSTPPQSPTLIESLSSSSDSCLASIKDQPHSNPEISFSGCTLYVDLVDTFNCCIDSIGIKLRVSGEFNLKIYFTGFVSSPCFCICPFATRAVVLIGQSGNYIVQLYDTEWTSGIWSSETSLVWQDTVAVTTCQ